MTATLLAPASSRPRDGGTPARRAVARWAWRLLRKEWRQQLLIVALIIFAVAATIVGSAVAINTPPKASFGFGTAQDAATFGSDGPQARNEIARLEHRFGRVELIENQNESIPGSINGYQLRAQDPHGPYGSPMLGLVSGRYPASADQVAVTSGVASAFNLKVGDNWRMGDTSRKVVGIVENPQSLLDEFALVLPGQVTSPTQVTVLFDANGVRPGAIAKNVQTPASVAQNNPINPETISLAALVLGMLLIALVSIGGFTVLAQRRMRSIGMLESTGATDQHVRLVVRANGTAVGVVGAVAGFVLGLVIWLAYRPTLEQSAHHVIGVLALPWVVVVASMVLAVVATTFAASRPAKAITKVPIVTALSGRPAPPRQIRRSAVPGIVLLVIAFLLLALGGSTHGGSGGGGMPEVALGLLVLVPGLILLAPFFLTLAAKAGRRAPIASRLALRDLARYRARSGSALAAISLGVLVASIVMLAAASRYGNAMDYAGPNLASNQLWLSANLPPPVGSVTVTPNGKQTVVTKQAPEPKQSVLDAQAQSIAKGLGAQLITLESPDVNINGSYLGRSWNGAIYVATPQLLKAFGISPSEINPNADLLTSRPGLSGYSNLDMSYGSSNGGQSGNGNGNGGGSGGNVANPVIQYVPALPTGVSAPNTVVTEHAMQKYHLTASPDNWLVQGSQPFSASQIKSAELVASKGQISVESKNDEPTSSSVINWATIFGIMIALGVLAMSVGLVRSETQSDLRTLAATGASSYTRRNLTAVTAGALGFLGALIGVLGAYVAMIGWLQGNTLNGGVRALGNIPIMDLLALLVGMPLFGALVGWIFAGREPEGIAQQPMA